MSNNKYYDINTTTVQLPGGSTITYRTGKTFRKPNRVRMHALMSQGDRKTEKDIIEALAVLDPNFGAIVQNKKWVGAEETWYLPPTEEEPGRWIIAIEFATKAMQDAAALSQAKSKAAMEEHNRARIAEAEANEDGDVLFFRWIDDLAVFFRKNSFYIISEDGARSSYAYVSPYNPDIKDVAKRLRAFGLLDTDLAKDLLHTIIVNALG